jgi:hypothetical protein
VLDHYLTLGGNEVVNSARAFGYATTGNCRASWLRDPDCDTIFDAQGDEQYEYANITQAPWYDPDDPDVTSRFLGLYGVDIRNLSDSTREATNTEKTTAGSQVSGYRHASREVRVRGWMTARGGDALEAGMTWLRNVLEPNACGIHGGACGESDSAFFVDCPPQRRDYTYYTDWVTWTNRITNPSFETVIPGSFAEVRRNRFTDPAATGLTAFGATAGQSTLSQVGGVPHWAIETDQPVGIRTIGTPVFVVGQSYRILLRARANRTLTGNLRLGSTNGPPIAITSEWQWFETTQPAGTTAVTNTGIVLTTAGGHVAGDWVEIDRVLIADGGDKGDWFSGASPTTDSDLDYVWVGAANASASVLQGARVAGQPSSAQQCAAVWSTQWAASRAASVRVIPTGSGNNSTYYATLATLGLETGKTYTALVTARLAAPQIGSLNPRARSLSLNVGDVVSQAPNTAGTHPLRITFTIDGTIITTAATLSLYNGAAAGNGEVWFDDFLIVEGEYLDGYFDGDTPDDPGTDGLEPLYRYAWTGAVDASTSTYEERVFYIGPEPDETYYPFVDEWRRYLHSVRCISGPFTVQEAVSEDGMHVGRLVEFTLLAEVPWVFGITKEIEVPPTVPGVMQDIAYNLFPFPSMELTAGAAFPVAINYATNPSLETNATQWSASVGLNSGSAPDAYFTSGRVTGELAAAGAGVASMRARILGNGSTAASGQARMQIYMTQSLAAIDPEERPSFSIWVAGVSVGGATGAQIVSIKGSVELGTGDPTPDLILDMGTITSPTDIAGHVFTAPSTEIPAGVTQAVIYITATVNWSSSATPASNSDIRIYADAVAITVP